MSIDDIKSKLEAPLREAGIVRAGIFGSIARGEGREQSDVDVLVECPKGMGLLSFVALKQTLEERLGRTVDLVDRDALKPQLKDSILRDYVPIV